MQRESLSPPHEDVRTALLTRLVEEHQLLGVAEEACAAAGIPEREQAVAYCLAVLVQKRTAVSRYKLDITEPDFGRHLGRNAATVAEHMREWGRTYQAIQDEADRFELTTIRRYVRTPLGADVIDATAAALAELLAGAVPLEEMTLALAYVEEPTGSEYVFQSPLGPWIIRSARRRFPPKADPLDERQPAEELGVDALLGAEEATAEDVLSLLARRVAETLVTRESLTTLIERADRFEDELARLRPASQAQAQLLVRLRAAIVDRADGLRRERRALPDLLAYVVLALRSAEKLQAVTILSLRSSSIEPEVVATMSERMTAMLADLEQPTPSLVLRTEDAVARGVSRRRASALRRLRDRPDKRSAQLAGVARALEALPSTVADNAAIAAAMPAPCNAHIVAVNRSTVSLELDAVDRHMARVYRRYTRGAR